MTPLLSTPLTAWHEEHGAKMAPFAGWNMPIQYVGIIAEHLHTREKASLFDICHMGEFILRGSAAAEKLGDAVTHNLATLEQGRCRYGFLLSEAGTVLDDLIIYCLGKDEYMLVVNAGCLEHDFTVLKSRLSDSLELEDVSSRTAKMDVQGPASFTVLKTLFPLAHLEAIPYFGFMHTYFQNAPVLISRTGYTGELGYEVYLDAAQAIPFWETALAHPLMKPAGLGARDTLRLEAGLPLYGHELDETHTPHEAGAGNFLKSEASFTGKRGAGVVKQILVPLRLEGRRSARNGDAVFVDGKQAGYVTSGSFAPSLGYAIAFAYIDAPEAGTENFLIRGQTAELRASRATLPFYANGTARISLKG